MADTHDGDVVIATLRHHDQQLGSLGAEVSSIQGVLKDHSSILGEIRGALSEMIGHQGPSFPRVMTMMLTGGGLIAMISGAITVLVLSLVSPQTTRLSVEAQDRDSDLALLMDDRNLEYRDMVKRQRDKFYSLIRPPRGHREWQQMLPHRNGARPTNPGPFLGWAPTPEQKLP